jgi:hypothetical protein
MTRYVAGAVSRGAKKGKTMQKNILLCLGALLFSTGCNAEKVPPVEDWIGHTSQDGTMSAKFPEKPEIKDISANTAIGRLDFRMIVYENAAKDVAFMISKVKYPVDPSEYDVKGGLNGAMQGAVTQVNGKLVSQKDIKMFGLPGKEMVIKAGKGPTIRARVFIDGKGPALYQV